MPNGTSFVSFRQPRYLTHARPEALRPAVADGLPFRGNPGKQGPRPGSSMWFRDRTLACGRRFVSDGGHTAMIRPVARHGCHEKSFPRGIAESTRFWLGYAATMQWHDRGNVPRLW